MALWRLARRRGGRAMGIAGPAIMVIVIVAWAGLVIVGFAMVYLAGLRGGGFVYGSGLDPGDRSGVVDAVYVSAVVLSTLGFGDIVPSDGWLRLVTALEALIGFSLLTAGISWITQVQQVLARRRSCARFLLALRLADGDGEGRRVEPTRALLEQAARDLAGTHVDLWQSTTSYYFRERDPDGSLAVALPWAAELARRGRESEASDVRCGAAVLDIVIDDLAGLLRSEFVAVDGTGREDVLEAFLDAHRQSRS